MSGFDSGNSQGISDVSKDLGAIMRGMGPPDPGAGVYGDIYIDTLTFQLFEKRQSQVTDPWGHYLFVVPNIYQPSLNWYGTNPPTNDVGLPGDYYIQLRGYPNYGLQPLIYGPKTWTGWPTNGDGPGTVIAAGTSANVIPTGLLAEGATVLDKQPAQLIATGLLAELTIPVAVTANDGDPVLQVGLQAGGTPITVALNPLYTGIDDHAI